MKVALLPLSSKRNSAPCHLLKAAVDDRKKLGKHPRNGSHQMAMPNQHEQGRGEVRGPCWLDSSTCRALSVLLHRNCRGPHASAATVS